jgi:hypothetical protein
VTLNNHESGPVANELYDVLTGIQYGRRADSYEWTTRVEVEQVPSSVALD